MTNHEMIETTARPPTTPPTIAPIFEGFFGEVSGGGSDGVELGLETVARLVVMTDDVEEAPVEVEVGVTERLDDVFVVEVLPGATTLNVGEAA